LKGALRGFALLLIFPWLLWYWLSVRVLPSRRDQVFQGISQLLALFPGVLGSFLRVAFYSRVFLRCGSDVHIGFGTIFATPEVSMADRVYIGPFCNIGHVDFGSDVLVGSNVTLLSGKLQHHFHRTDVPMSRQGGEYQRIRVDDDCWLGNGSIVMTSVSAHSIVAAGAVVSKAESEWMILAGNPARVIRSRLES
jgi:acetyltransferase-like isoleucine patch superfamily enzyme